MASLSDKYKNNLPFDSSNVTTITSNYTALNNDVVFVNTASSALTVTLPASPTAGSKIKVLDVAANSQNNIITVLGNGYNVSGASAYLINTPDSSAEFLFINNTKGWNVLNEYISLTKPGIPIGVSAVDVGTGRAYNNGAATVTFSPSTSGDEATSFTVTSTPGSYTAIGTSSPILVPGLQANISYTFKVYATNAAGNSSESTASDSITATTVPESPTILTVDYGFENLSVNYTAGATGGKAVSAYTATRTGGVTASGSSPISFSSLTGGTAYTISMTATNANGTSTASNSVVQTPFTTTGGSSITTSGGYRIHTFNGTSDFILTGNSRTVDYLVVAGGGSGAGNTTDGGGKGGGGAGGYRTSFGTSGANAGSESSLTLSPQTYSVVVGAGGTGPTGASQGASGSNSIFSTITSTGGGGGGAGYPGGPSSGLSGGSGGGAGYTNGSAGTGTANQGRNGGNTITFVNVGAGAGGGGASGVGGDGSSGSRVGGAGGAGLSNNLDGLNTSRAGGGGGAGAGGGGGSASSGGGTGGQNGGGSNATANTGGGGGGASSTSGSGGTKGGNGGSGIVIIRYAV
jgi:hypothetical protein